MRITLTVANFFKSILLHKNWRGGGEFLLENGTIDSYAYKLCYCSGWIYIVIVIIVIFFIVIVITFYSPSCLGQETAK